MRRFWEEGISSRGVAGPGYGKAVFVTAHPQNAQPYCNFVVLVPRQLPAGCQLGPFSVRTEGDRWSTVLFRVEGPGRRLRIKEFLYDWWTLTETATNLVGPGRPFRVGTEVGWHGIDYKGLPAAAFHRFRTQVEITVEEGEFAPAEIEALCEGLEPVHRESAHLLLQVPFARLSYTVRRGRGPWGYDRVAGCTWTTDLRQALAAVGMPVLVPAVLPVGLQIDSVGYRRSRKGAGGEFQLLIRPATGGADTIHLRGTQPGAQGGVTVPPGPDLRRQFQWSTPDLRSEPFYFGHILAQSGEGVQAAPWAGWAAVWHEEGVNWECHGRPGAILSLEGFRNFLLSLRVEYPGGLAAGGMGK